MKHRDYSQSVNPPSIEVLTRMLRTRGMKPEERAPLEHQLDQLRAEAGLQPIQRNLPPMKMASQSTTWSLPIPFGHKLARLLSL